VDDGHVRVVEGVDQPADARYLAGRFGHPEWRPFGLDEFVEHVDHDERRRTDLDLCLRTSVPVLLLRACAHDVLAESPELHHDASSTRAAILGWRL
jgi:hypothetical protein